MTNGEQYSLLKKGSGRLGTCPLATVCVVFFLLFFFQMALPPCFPVDGACFILVGVFYFYEPVVGLYIKKHKK